MKKIIIIISIILLMIISLIFIYYKQTVAVLCYHDLTTNKSSNNMQIEKDKFEQEMKYLKDHKYHTITLKEMECFLKDNCKIPRKSIMITFDDGYKSNYDIALPILKKYNLKAVIFYMGINYNTNNNYLNLNTLKKIKSEYPNIEIASHSFNLHQEDDYKLSKDIIDKDFKKMKRIINTKYFAYPYGHVSDNLINSLKGNNYKLAFTFGPGKEHRKVLKSDDKYHLPRLNISNDMPFWKYKIRLIMPY